MELRQLITLSPRIYGFIIYMGLLLIALGIFYTISKDPKAAKVKPSKALMFLLFGVCLLIYGIVNFFGFSN